MAGAAVCRALGQFAVPYEVSPRLVRGLDYYTNTVFEIVSEGLGAQNAICGGGAYEGLVEELGGPATYGVGFAIGEDRLLEVLPGNSPARGLAARRFARGPVVVAPAGKLPQAESGLSPLFELAERLRRMGLPAVEALAKRERVFEWANSIAAPIIIFVGEDELATGRYSLRTLASGERQVVIEAKIIRWCFILRNDGSYDGGDRNDDQHADG